MGATYDMHRLVYSPLLHPENFNGQKVLVVHEDLEKENPGLYNYLMNFIQSNKLRFTRLCDLPGGDALEAEIDQRQSA